MERADEAQFPIRIVARRTGLTPHVLRAWERRYGVVTPNRSEAGERLYSNADIFRLRLLRRLTEGGRSIGRIGGLDTAELLALVREEGEAPAAQEPRRPPVEWERFVRAALEALEGMDGVRLYSTLMRALVALPLREFVEGVTIPLLHQVGELWAEGRICPAHEHVLSSQLVRVLGWLSDAAPVPAGAPNAVAGTPSGQRHEFGALLASVVAAETGWRVTYLGPDLPASDIATAVQVRSAEVVLLSVVMEEEDSDAVLGEVRELRAAIGGRPRILLGGRGAAERRDEVERAGATWLASLGELRERLSDLHPSNPVARP
jgi:MerR family transcriptional regulator, light-induced transcriptional regulator